MNNRTKIILAVAAMVSMLGSALWASGVLRGSLSSPREKEVQPYVPADAAPNVLY